MKRRTFILGLAALPAIGAANPAGIAALAAVVVLLANAGDALSKISKGFRDLVTAGSDSYSYVAAARERDRLKILSKDLRELTKVYNETIVRSIDDYIILVRDKNTKIDRIERGWKLINQHIDETLKLVRELLVDVKKEQGDFILMPAYDSLFGTLKTRSLTLNALKEIETPMSAAELVELEKVSEKYKILIANAKEATSQLNAYVLTVGNTKK